MSDMQLLTEAITKGNRAEAKRLTQVLLDAGSKPQEIVDGGLVPGMAIIGDKFKRNEAFVPEMLIAARAMKESMAILEPLLTKAGIKPKYTAVIGTVQGDLHDIGKNLVGMMLKGANIGVIDLGTNVTADRFISAAKEHNAQIIGLSALLTTTMPAMKETVAAVRQATLGNCKVVVGGAPVTREFATQIGADGYASDAASAVDEVMKLVAEIHKHDFAITKEPIVQFKQLAIPDAKGLCFGVAPRPLKTRKGMTIGGGQVYPELNFTLPAISIEASTMPEILTQYREIIEAATHRAVELETPGLVIEFETLPPMTQVPSWGIDITKVLVDGLENAHAKLGLKSTLRVTPNDTREFERPPIMRSGQLYEDMLKTFEGAANAGAELLSIESVGGKEVHDDALTMGDMAGVIFSLCVMGVRDMQFLWTQIAQIAKKTGAICAGDTACGFANTAMVLAEQKLISRVFAATVRAISAVRSLVAYECGAVGPGKDCGYENVILKAITGFPMAMEGKSATCAHLSPVGNVAAAACDTWSNESVQNIKLLGGMAPLCSLETLAYDCRLMNQASADGPDAALQLRRWMVRSDAGLDPQAFILAPESAIAIAKAIVAAPNPYAAGKAAALTAIQLFRDANKDGQLKLPPRELAMLDIIRDEVEALPDSEQQFISDMMGLVDTTKFIPRDYGL